MKVIAAAAFLAMVALILTVFTGDAVTARPLGEDPADYANVSWILICSILVFIMSPGVALFYGGMLRKQSMTSIIAQTLMAMGIMSISWIVVG